MEDETSLDTKSEIIKYLLDNLEKLGSSDILDLWKLNASNYPILSKMTRGILAIPISIVASESAFSTSGRILMHLGIHYLLKQWRHLFVHKIG